MLRRLLETLHVWFLKQEPAEAAVGRFRAGKPLLYVIVVMMAAFATVVFQMRTKGIFACQAAGYVADRYLESCRAEGYGDYDHGAFWFGLEPRAGEFVRKADVLFMGSSRMQFAFSTATTAEWFSSKAARYYLLGFAFSEKYLFEQELLRKLRR